MSKRKPRKQSISSDNSIWVTIDKEEEAKYEKNQIKTETMYFYVNFLPSGKHHFYFIRNGKFFTLSKKY